MKLRTNFHQCIKLFCTSISLSLCNIGNAYKISKVNIKVCSRFQEPSFTYSRMSCKTRSVRDEEKHTAPNKYPSQVKPFLPSSVLNEVYQQMASPWVAFEMHQQYRVLPMTFPNIRMLEIQLPLILLQYILKIKQSNKK